MLMAVYNPIEVDGRVKRISEALAERFDLTLLCPEPTRVERYHGPGYRIIRAPRGHGGRVGRQMAFWTRFILLACSMKPTCVYAHDFFLSLPGWLAARLSGARLIYDAHELIVPTPGEVLSFRDSFFYRLERWVVPRAELVIAANPERASTMADHYHLSVKPTAIRNIPPVPTSVIDDSTVLNLYPGLRKSAPADLHVIYMGDMSLARGIGLLVQVADLLPAHVKILLVGGGPDLETLREMAVERGDNRVRVIGPLPHSHVFDALRQADLGYVTYSMRGLNNILCAPNKVFEYAQAGLPMVATCQPTIKALFEEHRIGHLVGCDGKIVSSDEIAAAVAEVLADPVRYRRNLSAFLSQKTWASEAARLQLAVGAILG
jgi:glycosyltransferase involved in cell wall biosynthesis